MESWPCIEAHSLQDKGSRARFCAIAHEEQGDAGPCNGNENRKQGREPTTSDDETPLVKDGE
jgi:hypothetical protein